MFGSGGAIPGVLTGWEGSGITPFLHICAGEGGDVVGRPRFPQGLCVVGRRAEASNGGTAFWLVFQEAIFNKSTGKVVLKTFSLYKKLLTFCRAGHDQGEEVWAPWKAGYSGLGGGQR